MTKVFPNCMKSSLRTLAIAITALTVLLSAGCSSDEKKKRRELEEDAMVIGKSDEEIQREAAAFYVHARKSLDAKDFRTAVTEYERLSRRYPFTDFATQAQVERTYALYRSYEPDKALASADKFLREHPRSASAAYVQYLKGLINFDRQTTFTDFLPYDDTRNDVTYERLAFDDFALLVRKYPDSRYVADARERMIYLRNRIAQHELSIVDFYMRRGAYVAAAKRAEQTIAQYPGSPGSYEALGMLERAYRKAGLRDQADDVARVRAAQGLTLKQVVEPGDDTEGGIDWWPFGGDRTDELAAPPAL